MPRPPAKRLKLNDESFSECSGSETSKQSRKPRGKKTRSNEKIGGLTMENAIRIAERITGYHCIDLRLPHREEADAVDSIKWISKFDEEDIVIQRKLCLICMQNPMSAFLRPHVKANHPEMPAEVTEVLRRLSDVRYTRFCSNGFTTDQMIREMYPQVPRVPLINFLASCGILYLRKNRKAKIKIDFDNVYEEPDFRGVCKKKATEMVSKMHKEGLHFYDELSFSSNLVTNSRMLDPSTQTTVCCYLCEKVLSVKNLTRHIQAHKKSWSPEEEEECSLDDLTELFKRITEIRTVLYYAAQPIQHSKIRGLCRDDQDACKRLMEFLLDAGFVVDSRANGERKSTKTPKVIVYDPDCEDALCLHDEKHSVPDNFPDEDSLQSEPPELSLERDSSTDNSVSSRRSRSNSVTSDTSSASSTSSINSRITLRPSSSPSEEPFPYCILSGIAEHAEVEHALFDLLEAMTDDSDFTLNQVQFGFLLGYTSYCLVVANGSKQNVVSRLTMGDYRKAKIDEASGLYYFSFSTKTTCTRKDTFEYLCADQRIWRAIEIYEVARERRVREAKWSRMDDDDAPFFCSYMSPSAIVKDTNYPMSQFLRMCGISWPCRSGAICSAAWSLVPKDTGKLNHHQYSITYFKFLREKERSQIQLIDGGGQLSSHPTYRKITSVVLGKANNKVQVAPHDKVRKKQKRYTTPERKGVRNLPRGGDHKSDEFRRRTGREVIERPPKREPKWRRRTEKEILEEELYSGEEPEDCIATMETANIVKEEPIPLMNQCQHSPEIPIIEMKYRVEADGELLLTCL